MTVPKAVNQSAGGGKDQSAATAGSLPAVFGVSLSPVVVVTVNAFTGTTGASG